MARAHSAAKKTMKPPKKGAGSNGSGLPDFAKPPAVETLLGLHFKPLAGWSVPHFGLFWNAIKRNYPQVEVHPPITSEMALKFEVDPRRVQFQLTSEVPVRCWFIHKSGSRLIQVQNSSFIQNWRKPAAGAEYLHYDDLWPTFIEMWGAFRRFLSGNSVEQPSITDCEVTYINHIDRGEGWDHFAQLSEIIPAWCGEGSGNFLPAPLSVSINAFYPIKDNAGRLEITVQPGVRKADGKETIQLVLTAKCRPQSPDVRDLKNCLDLAREWVVRGFDDFTSERMHEVWQKRARKEMKL